MKTRLAVALLTGMLRRSMARTRPCRNSCTRRFCDRTLALSSGPAASRSLKGALGSTMARALLLLLLLLLALPPEPLPPAPAPAYNTSWHTDHTSLHTPCLLYMPHTKCISLCTPLDHFHGPVLGYSIYRPLQTTYRLLRGAPAFTEALLFLFALPPVSAPEPAPTTTAATLGPALSCLTAPDSSCLSTVNGQPLGAH